MTNFKTVKGQTTANSKSSSRQNVLEPLNQTSKNEFLETNSKINSENKIGSIKNNIQLLESNELTSLPDLVIIVGQEKELKAIKECQKLNIPTITILDSDGDPEKTSLFIPANDDSRSSVEFILKHLGQSILVGRLLYDKKKTRVIPESKQKRQTSNFSRRKVTVR